MGAVVDGKLVNLTEQKFGTFGQDTNIPIIATSTLQLTRAIVKKIKYNNQL